MEGEHTQTQQPPRRRRWRLLFAGTLGWIAGTLLLVWLTAPSWILPLLQHFNKEQKWWDILDFGVSHIDSKTLNIEYVRYQKENINLYTDGLSVTYTPSGLLEGKIDSVLLQPLHITIDIDPLFAATDKNLNETDSSSSDSPAQLISLLETTWSELPYQQLLASEVEILLKQKNHEALVVNAMLNSQANEKEFAAQANLHFFEESIDFDTRLSLENPTDRRAQLSVHIWNLKDLLDRLRPMLPDDVQKSIDAYPFRVGALYGALDWLADEQLLATQWAISNFSYENQVILEGLTLETEAPQDLSSLSGKLEIPVLIIPGIASTSIEANFKWNQLLQSDRTLTATVDTTTILSEPTEETAVSILTKPIHTKLRFSGSTISAEAPLLSSPLAPVNLKGLSAILALPKPEDSQGMQFQASTLIEPQLPGWNLEISDPTESINLSIQGNAESEITGIESFHTTADLKVPKIKFKGTLPVIPSPENLNPKSTSMEGFALGSVHAQNKGSTVALALETTLQNLTFAQPDVFKLETEVDITASSDIDTEAVISDPANPLKALNQLEAKLHLNGKGNASGVPFSIQKLELELNSEHPITQGIPFNLRADQIKWDTYRLLNPQSNGLVTETQLQMAFESAVIKPEILATANFHIDWTTGEQTGELNIQNADPQARTSLSLHNIIPDIATTLFGGIFQAHLNILFHQNTLTLPFSGSLIDGQLTLPDSGFSIEGIQLPEIEFSDLVAGTTATPISIDIQKINYAPVIVENVHTRLSIDTGYTLQVETLRFRFCEGDFEVTVKKPVVAPYDSLSCRVEFKNVDIKQLTDLIPDFKENLTGKIDGYLPFVVEKGQVAWGRGKANLSPGTTARLRYAENGLFASYIPEIVISKDLDIDINKALRDITITEMTLDIQPSAQFDKPSILVMSGHSNNSKIEIPIERIQLNIRAGDIPGLLNRSIKSNEWIQGVLFGK